jgi:predicted RND superfamily exporter protein
MSDTERTPLRRDGIDGRAQVRAEVREVVTRSLLVSYVLTVLGLFVSLVKVSFRQIVTAIVVLAIASDYCADLLFIYVVGCLVMDFLYAFLLCYKLNHMRTRATFPGEVSWVRHSDTGLSL